MSDVADARPFAVSVVMPAFNEAEILETTVADVVDSLRRREGSFELVVCENGSTDDTLAIARGLAEKFVEVDVQHLPDADYGAALHAGLRASVSSSAAAPRWRSAPSRRPQPARRRRAGTPPRRGRPDR